MIRKIALVIKTSGLDYDDRVRKEIVTVKKLFPEVEFDIFAMLPENKETRGVTSYGVPYKTVYIPARDKYGPAEKVFLKSYQFFRAIEKDLWQYDAVWAADNSATIFPLLLKHKRILWDLHELPSDIMYRWWGKLFLKRIFRRCKVLLHANQGRIAYLQSIGVINNPDKHIAVRNYPNFDDVDTEYDDKYRSFMDWKKDRRCVYLQGLANASRASYESIEAVLKSTDFCAVVVGGFDKNAEKRLKEQYGNELEKRVFFVGQIAQLKIPQYVKECYMSLVFYKNTVPNNWYCEANRFYQSIILGLPVVVGNNPSMKELVEKYGFGVSIEDDGRDIEKISDGIHKVIEGYEEYHNNIMKNRNNLLWDNQEPVFKIIIEMLMK